MTSATTWLSRARAAMCRRPMLSIFLTLATIYIASPVSTSYDSRWSLYVAMSFLRSHDGNLSEYGDMIRANADYAIEYRNGKPYSFFPIGVSVLAVPAVALATVVDPGFNDTLKRRMQPGFEKLLASLCAALAGTLFFSLVRSRFAEPPTAIASTFVFALCTPMWSTASRALWQHGPLATMLVAAMILLVRARNRPELIQYLGLPLAAAFVIRPTAAAAILVFSLYVLAFHRRWLIRYVCFALPLAIAWLAYNLHVSDDLLSSYYDPARLTTGAHPGMAALGILVSPSRGLFVYSPVLLLALPGFVISLRDGSERWLHLSFMAIAVGIWLGVAHHYDWFGGHCYGPRFMTDIVPFLVYFSAFSLERIWRLKSRGRRVALAFVGSAAALSFLISAEGAVSYRPYAWNVLPEPIFTAQQRLWDWGDPQFLRIFSPISAWTPPAKSP